MKKEKGYIDQIESYLEGSLSKKEKENFERELKSNPELYEEYQNRIKIADLWQKSAEYQETRQMVKRVIRNNKKKHVYTVISIAASIIILLAVWAIINPSTDLNNNPIIAISDSTTVEPGDSAITTQIDVPKNRARHYQIPKYELKDTVSINWLIPVESNAKISIKDYNTDRLVYTGQVDSGKLKHLLDPGKMPVGHYLWEIDDTNLYGYFLIYEAN